MAFALMVISSGMASWSDLAGILSTTFGSADSALVADAKSPGGGALSGFNIGYFWMIANCFSSAGYVGTSYACRTVYSWAHQLLTMRKKIKQMGFKDWDTMFYNNLLPIPLLAVFSFIMEDWSIANLEVNL